jgi:hypothetical protein
MEEFQTRFTDFEITKNDIALFHNSFIVVNKEQPAPLQLELRDLQTDPFWVPWRKREWKCSKFFL